jgi:hypothetical protein
MKTYGTGLAAVGIVAAIVVACSGNSPADNCRDFLDLTNDCYQKSGKQPIATNSAACDDASVEDPRTQAQMTCSLQYSDMYCRIIQVGGTAAAADLVRDAQYIKLNACIASSVMAEPCKAAVLALADCGAGFGFANADTCTGPSAGLAKCIVDNKAGACSLYQPVPRTSSTLTPEETAFQKCVQDVQIASLDAGTKDTGRD